MNCTNCSAPVRVIPAGTSKKPPFKPYKSFWKCNECGKSESIGQGTQSQPQGNPAPQDTWTAGTIKEILEIVKRVEKKLDNLETIEPPEEPF